MDPEFAGKLVRSGAYTSGRTDLDQIPDTPNRRAHHRRALSETFFRFSNLDDFLLDDLASEMNIDLPPAPASNLPYASPPPAQLCKAHLRSLSVDADFFEGLALNGGPPVSDSFPSPSPVSILRHTNSMDGYSSATSADVDSGKKAMAPDRLAKLALIDPQRAKRILANRQSAARSKERKVHYTGVLERKVHTLQTEATTLSAQTTLLQRDATGLANENRELKLKLQAMEQQAHLRDALNETLSNELQRLKIAAGQIPAVNGNNRGLTSEIFSRPPTFSYMGNNQAQQQQQQTRQPVHYPNNPRLGGQLQPTFQDFNHRA